MKRRAGLRSLLDLKSEVDFQVCSSEPWSRMPWEDLGQRNALSHLRGPVTLPCGEPHLQGKGISNERALSKKTGCKRNGPTPNNKERQGTGEWTYQTYIQEASGDGKALRFKWVPCSRARRLGVVNTPALLGIIYKFHRFQVKLQENLFCLIR